MIHDFIDIILGFLPFIFLSLSILLVILAYSFLPYARRIKLNLKNPFSKKAKRIFKARAIVTGCFITVLFVLMSTQLDLYDVNIERYYEDVSRDTNALEKVENFNISDVVENFPDNMDIFPPYDVENRFLFKPFVGAFDSSTTDISYTGNVSYPNSSVNLTAFLIQEYNGPFDHWYFQENEVEILHVLENGTWNTYDLLTNDTFNLSWLVQVDYSSSRGCGGIYHSFLYGLNESQDIVLVVDVPTWEYGYCCLKMDPTIFIIFMGAVMVLASLVTASTGMALMKGERMYINHDNLLDNPTRGKIYRLIQERPGTHFSRIKDILLINPRTLLHHVDILKKFKKIREVNFQNKTLYFDRNLDDKFDFLYFHLNDEKKIKVLKQILLNPGCSFVDLLATLDMPRTTLARHIAALANEGILDIYHEGNQIVSINVHEKFEDFVLESIKRINSPFK